MINQSCLRNIVVDVLSLNHVWLCNPTDSSTPGSPPLSPGVRSDSCPLCWWCYLIISSSVAPFSSYPQSFPASGSFPKSQFFTSGGHNIGTSASASVLSMNIQGLFPLRLDGLTGFISLQSVITIKFFPAHVPSPESVASCFSSHPHQWRESWGLFSFW